MTLLSLDVDKFEPHRALTAAELNPSVIGAEYAVRGTIPQRAEALHLCLQRSGHGLPFTEIVGANIGNPQDLGQKPLTFVRQVLSLLQYPESISTPERRSALVKAGIYKLDAIVRAQELLLQIGNSVGAYSASQGVFGIRQTVANFIEKRDQGIPSNPNDIYLTCGATRATQFLFSILCQGPSTAVMVPIPQYPLYSAELALRNTEMISYYLNESDNWSVDPVQIEADIISASERGVKTMAIVVINPGNPTGAVLAPEVIAEIIIIAAKYGVVIIADEVYQENVFEGTEFHSFKKILGHLICQYPGKFDQVQLASLHSTSKGVIGECGQRGGYMELFGFQDDVKQNILKLATIEICAVVTGQAVVSLMVDPPKPGDDSYETDVIEKSNIKREMYTRALLLHKMFSKLDGIHCSTPQGAMYLYATLDLPLKAIKEAEQENLCPDVFYCKKLLENTGICTVPGSGFGQRTGTYHLRTTFLAPGIEWIQRWENFHVKFMREYSK